MLAGRRYALARLCNVQAVLWAEIFRLLARNIDIKREVVLYLLYYAIGYRVVKR